jgi:nucleotide-binding universal stress UspA family protein
MYKTILVGIDGSEPSLNAFNVALEMAKKFGSKLLIVTVYSPPAIGLLGDIPPYPPTIPKEVSERMEKLLKELEEKAKKEGVNAESKIISSWVTPGAGLVAEAEKQGCALIVIGSRGLTGLKRALLGSIADYVVKNAHCSVHIVR